ncbi:MAG: hypothetical protein SV765_01560 [Pseudomonadota bacterium]|nr:hypothetical protein [Pseudomonadales bacterium]MDY6918880.1 hypothetical protein [Pseudomonadota bacterium]
MGINCHEFLEFVIQPTLQQLGVDSPAAEQLLLATACHQSEMGHHLQRSEGIGIYGITPAMHQSVWDDYLAQDCDMASLVRGMASQHEFPKSPHSELATNLRYATAIAWMIYLQRGLELDDHQHRTTEEMAEAWQKGFMDRPISVQEREQFCRGAALLHPASRPAPGKRAGGKFIAA